MNAPPVTTVKDWRATYDKSKGPLIDMSQAAPGYQPHPAIINSMMAALQDPATLSYGPGRGDESFVEAYAHHSSSIYQSLVGKEDIQVTSGCNQAFGAVALCIADHEAGDEIILTKPVYFNHATTLDMFGITARYVDLDASQGLIPDPEIIKKAIGPRTKAIVLVNPNNPAGVVYPNDILEALYDICQEAGVWLILDETYREFLPMHYAIPHNLFQREDWRDTFISLYSFSKSFAIPGARLGAITCGPR